ncbi:MULTISPECIES: Uma2 family endonuclease [Streptomyces]|uniref:Uma2 family endonuclease n=1 Tax=Streptomyces TaxID=1883 RepID=UPI00163B66B0|nr:MULTISPECIES: Uma2 family endonuclease [Streptomyces]MBC2877315.1 Uma2 family endonuclease [Streptomyces sp. TYQ1024]UBI38125.1 Uma2 family endonuclease [Streptomyces mobaraensis]UKW30710.1 Uma2 family endonuclease [Streptomyces sp. TYQ1024]
MATLEVDRMRSRLSRFEGRFDGCKVEIVGGALVMSPVRPFHNETMLLLWSSLRGQLSADWRSISDVTVPFDDDYEFCPDLAVIPQAEAAKNLSQYSPDLVELAIEVVSPSSARNDYETKNRWYASRGIADYLIFDPYQGHCVTHWNPGPDGYLGRDTIPYGKTVTVDSAVGFLKFDTSELPVDPAR